MLYLLPKKKKKNDKKSTHKNKKRNLYKYKGEKTEGQKHRVTCSNNDIYNAYI